MRRACSALLAVVLGCSSPFSAWASTLPSGRRPSASQPPSAVPPQPTALTEQTGPALDAGSPSPLAPVAGDALPGLPEAQVPGHERAPIPPAEAAAAAAEEPAAARTGAGEDDRSALPAQAGLAELSRRVTAEPKNAPAALGRFFENGDQPSEPAPSATAPPSSSRRSPARLAAAPAPAGIVPGSSIAPAASQGPWLGAMGWLSVAASPWLPLLIPGWEPSAVSWIKALTFGLGIFLGSQLARTLPKALQGEPVANGAFRALSALGVGILVYSAALLLAATAPAAAAAAGVSAIALALGWHSGPLEAAWEAATRRGPQPMMRIVRRGGKDYFDLGPEDLGRLRLLSSHIDKGLGERDLYSSRMWGFSQLWYLRRSGDSVELVLKNDQFRAAAGSAQEKALEASIADSVVARARAIPQAPFSKRSWVPVDSLFGGDLLNLGAELTKAYQGDYELEDEDNVEDVRAFPRNLELHVRQHFKRKDPGEKWDGWGKRDSLLADTRRLTFDLRYSLLELPPAGFAPRRGDPRVGFFESNFEDWSDDQAPFLERGFIQRWRLEKTDPAAAASPVKKPIVFWIDPSVPPEYHEAVRRGILGWNPAFERLGLLNALQVKLASEAPDYDSQDARFNVIRFYLENDSSFAIGPSHANPLTGEIYHAGVSVSMQHPRAARDLRDRDMPPPDDVSRRGRGRADAHHADYGLGTGASNSGGERRCRAGEHMAREAALALDAIEAAGGTAQEKERLIEDYITDLLLHEVGHTLGLRHNFKASAWLPNNRLGESHPFVASVMDYTPFNVAGPGEKQGAMMSTVLGPYDQWAIEYGYTPLDGLSPAEAASRLADIAARSSEPGLAYGTDEDSDFMDPLAQSWDLGADPLAFVQSRVAVIRGIWASLAEPGSRGRLDAARVFMNGWFAYRRAVLVAARFLGGIYFDRSRAGKGGAPLLPVPPGRQRRALKLLDRFVFSDEPFQFPAAVLRKAALPPTPTIQELSRGANYFDPLDLTLRLRKTILERLFAVDVLERFLLTTKLQGPGRDPFTLHAYLRKLTASIWKEMLQHPKKEDPGPAPEYDRVVLEGSLFEEPFTPQPKSKAKAKKELQTISVSRRQLQDEHVTRLIQLGMKDMTGQPQLPEISSAVRSHALWLTRRLSEQLREGKRERWDAATLDHFEQMIHRLEGAYENDK